MITRTHFIRFNLRGILLLDVLLYEVYETRDQNIHTFCLCVIYYLWMNYSEKDLLEIFRNHFHTLETDLYIRMYLLFHKLNLQSNS